MSKLAICYWSGTGNTELMANAVKAGMEEAGAQVDVFTPDGLTAGNIADYDGIALGCPAMGAEELEEDSFLPVYNAIKDKLTGKNIALFGSYGWGDGEWMRSWEDELNAIGAIKATESVIANDAPNAEEEEQCKALGKALAV